MQALIFGDGPAARLAAITLHTCGANVVRALPRAGLGPPPTARHTHVIPDEVHFHAVAIDPDLAQDLTAHKQPNWRWMWNTGTEWTDYLAPRTSRAMIDAALSRRLSGLAVKTWHDAEIIGCDNHQLICKNGADQNGTEQRSFDLVVDATGAHRATRPMLQRLGLSLTLETAGTPILYQTFELEFPNQAGTIRWASPPVGDPSGAHYGDIEGQVMRITASMGNGGARRIETARAVAQCINPRVAALIPAQARLTHKTSTVLPQFRRMRTPATHMPPWLALGDARAQWAPRLGTGLSAIFRQCRILAETLRGGGSVADARAGLDAYLDKTWDLNIAALPQIMAGPNGKIG